MEQREILEVIKNHKFNDLNCTERLTQLLQMFAVDRIQKDPHSIFESGYFGPGCADLIDSSFESLIKAMRPHLIPLIEIAPAWQRFNFSTIGNEYGDIYEAQYDFAVNSKLNTGKPPRYYETLMKPLMTKVPTQAKL